MENSINESALESGEAFTGRQLVNRVTIRVEMIRHRGEHNPKILPATFAQLLTNDEDVYQREYRLTAAGELDTHYVQEPAWLMLKNTTKWEGGVIPTDEQRKDIESRILLVGPPERWDWLTLQPGQGIPLPAKLPVILTPKNGPVTISIMCVPK